MPTARPTVLSPEQVMQDTPSALRLYLRSSSTWMLVSGRKSSGARLAGRRRLANTRDRTRMVTKSPAGMAGDHAQGGLSPPLALSCTLLRAQEALGSPMWLGDRPVGGGHCGEGTTPGYPQ